MQIVLYKEPKSTNSIEQGLHTYFLDWTLPLAKGLIIAF